jgi:hypothetical protein
MAVIMIPTHLEVAPRSQSPPEPLSHQESEDKREARGFAESTIEATVWLICHRPARLPVWLAHHPNGKVLEKIARGRIKNERRAALAAREDATNPAAVTEERLPQ